MTPTDDDSRWIIELADGSRFPVDRELRIGRLPDCDVPVRDTLASGHHAAIRPDGQGCVVVTDLGSTNGTYIGEERLSGSRTLTAGTTIVVGTTPIVVSPARDLATPCWIVVETGPSAGAACEIQEGSQVRIGRDEDCDLVIDDIHVSHHHLRVTRASVDAGAGLSVEDLDSANGTRVEGIPIARDAPTALRMGDRLEVGDSVLVVADSRTPPPARQATAIRSVPADLRAAAGAATSSPDAPHPPQPGRRRAPLLIAGLAALIVVGAGAVVLTTRGADDGGSGTVQSVVETQRERTIQVLAELADGAGSGSGIVIDAEQGLVLTNAHVIAGADALEVKLDDGARVVPATLVSSMPCEDLALLQITEPADRAGLSAATISATQLEVGEQVVALGFPGSAESAASPEAFATDQLSATEGIISKSSAKYIDPASGVAPLQDTIQHTAPINHGNSGGPLFDLDGNLIGINTALYADATGQRLEGVNYAISANRIADLIERMRAGATPGEYGLSLVPAYEEGEALPSGLEVTAVASGSSADEAGIDVGTFVVGVDGEEITDLVAFCAAVDDDQPHTLTLWDNDLEDTRDYDVQPGVWVTS